MVRNMVCGSGEGEGVGMGWGNMAQGTWSALQAGTSICAVVRPCMHRVSLNKLLRMPNPCVIDKVSALHNMYPYA
jgi:hypothetical protein